MSSPNELALFDFRTRPYDDPFYTTVIIDNIEYTPFRAGGRDGLIWHSQGIWLMAEAAAIIAYGGYVTGERRRLVMTEGGFAPDEESGRMAPVGRVIAEHDEETDLPAPIDFLVREAARVYNDLSARAVIIPRPVSSAPYDE